MYLGLLGKFGFSLPPPPPTKKQERSDNRFANLGIGEREGFSKSGCCSELQNDSDQGGMKVCGAIVASQTLMFSDEDWCHGKANLNE